MAERCFRNPMPEFVPENPEMNEEEMQETRGKIRVHHQGTQDSLLRLLSLPYSTLSEQFRRAALDLKETIVVNTWARQRLEDFSLYTGALGTAFLLLKSFQVNHNENDLNLCLEIVKACDATSVQSRDVSFMLGRAGICAVGAVASKYTGNDRLVQQYLAKFSEIRLSKDHPDELLYGRAGYLWTCLFLSKNLGKDTVSSSNMESITGEIFRNGRNLSERGGSPLMFELQGQGYWGAAHGLAGILQVLMEFHLKNDELEDVKGTLKYMVRNRFPSGNYPVSEEDKHSDILVHWCHGAPGVALTLVKAAEVFGDKEFLEAAMEAAEVVWNRGLLKRVGLCHGISGNAYVFLSLYRLTGMAEYLYRAKAFASFLLDRAHQLISSGELHGGDNPHSLFEGTGGMAYLFLDMVHPTNSKFPGYEL